MIPADPRAEAARRDRWWNPAQRWRALQEFLDWADAQQPVSRNAPAQRLREEALKRRRLERPPFPRSPNGRAGAGATSD